MDRTAEHSRSFIVRDHPDWTVAQVDAALARLLVERDEEEAAEDDERLLEGDDDE